LIALYFSAEWCGPCRKFTPQLVDHYKRVAREYPNLRSFFTAWIDRFTRWKCTRATATCLGWRSISPSQRKRKPYREAGDRIPSLVLINSTRNLISSSYSGDNISGRKKPLTDLDAIFAEKAPQRLVSAQ
jgi:nucleoredoxin